jgi:hypothetical protein
MFQKAINAPIDGGVKASLDILRHIQRNASFLPSSSLRNVHALVLVALFSNMKPLGLFVLLFLPMS